MTKLEELKQAIYSVWKEGKELSFGCGVEIVLLDYMKNRCKGTKQITKYLSTLGETLLGQENVEVKITKIIGHPIGIAEVLRAIEEIRNSQYKNIKGVIFRHTKLGEVKSPEDDKKDMLYLLKNWKLEKNTLDNQAPEIINFLWDLICKK